MRPARCRPVLAATCAACAWIFLAWAAPANGQTVRQVVAVHLGREDFPSNPVLSAAIQKALVSPGDPRVEYFAEYLESETFGMREASLALSDYLRRKYRRKRIDLVIALSDPSLRFALDHRSDLFSDAPIVFAGLDRPDEATRRSGAGIAGVLVGAAYAETLNVALQLHPSTERVFVIARSPMAQTVTSVRTALRDFSSRVQLTYMEEGTLAGLLRSIRAIPPRSLVLYVWYSQDVPGHVIDSDETAGLVANEAPVPVYGTSDFYVERGVVGGLVRRTEETGTRVGEIARRILKGTRAQDIPIEHARLVPTFDGRQLQRWGIDERRLPEGSRVVARPPSLWIESRTAVLWTLLIGSLQLALIVGLLYQRQARRKAEFITRRQLAIAAHLERQLAMGELAAVLAHELNQPLCAIGLNAQAAERMLASNLGSVDELRNIVRDILDDGVRARRVIQRQRVMLQKRDMEKRRLDLNTVVRESLAIIAHEAEARRVHIEVRWCAESCVITGDQILLQQVVLNLALNAMDAMMLTPVPRRRLTVMVSKARQLAEVSVQDRGEGIAPAVSTRIFDPFVTTKANGMGIGLAIARDIIDSHGGTIEARNNDDSGTTFWFTLPLASTDGRVKNSFPD